MCKFSIEVALGRWWLESSSSDLDFHHMIGDDLFMTETLISVCMINRMIFLRIQSWLMSPFYACNTYSSSIMETTKKKDEKTVTYLSNTNESIFNIKTRVNLHNLSHQQKRASLQKTARKFTGQMIVLFTGEKAKFQRRKKRSGAFKCIIYHRQKSSKLIV